VSTADGPGDPGCGLHGRPTARELVEAVAGFLRELMEAQTEEAARYQLRVARRTLEVVCRELEQGPAQEEAHRGRLAALGVADDVALAAAIRAGRLDDHPGLMEALRADARDRLLVANPGWLLSDHH
jgi:hypothetical protein